MGPKYRRAASLVVPARPSSQARIRYLQPERARPVRMAVLVPVGPGDCLGPYSGGQHETRVSAAQSSSASSSPRPAERAQVKLAALLGSPAPLYFGLAPVNSPRRTASLTSAGPGASAPAAPSSRGARVDAELFPGVVADVGVAQVHRRRRRSALRALRRWRRQSGMPAVTLRSSALICWRSSDRARDPALAGVASRAEPRFRHRFEPRVDLGACSHMGGA